MSALKKGDRVRVKADTRPYAGMIGTVVSRWRSFYDVYMDNCADNACYHIHELELVEAAPQEKA